MKPIEGRTCSICGWTWPKGRLIKEVTRKGKILWVCPNCLELENNKKTKRSQKNVDK